MINIMAVIGTDGKIRCFGGEKGKELYAQYHDQEWGKLNLDDLYLFEMLILEGAQAGLSFETVLKKREAYRQAFHHFDPKKVATLSDSELEHLLTNEGLIRNRLKIFSTRQNAQVFLSIQKEFGSFHSYLWRFTEGRPIKNCWNALKDIPSSHPISYKLSKDLKKRGMNFVGPTIIYAYLQAVGLIDDHIKECWCY
jgi:DNA-3-methyladenine glycosylase I